MTTDIHQILLERLHQQGINTEEAPALLRDLFKILESNPCNRPGGSKLETSAFGMEWLEVGLPFVPTGTGVDGI